MGINAGPLKVDTPEFAAMNIFDNTEKGMEGSVLENVVDVVVDNVEYGLNGFWTGCISVKAKSGDNELKIQAVRYADYSVCSQ